MPWAAQEKSETLYGHVIEKVQLIKCRTQQKQGTVAKNRSAGGAELLSKKKAYIQELSKISFRDAVKRLPLPSGNCFLSRARSGPDRTSPNATN